MTMELITGHAGSAHVSGADAGDLIAGIVGRDSYTIGEPPSLTMDGANSLKIGPCSIVVQGRHIRITDAETLALQSGTQSAYRKDIVYLCYRMAQDTHVESAALSVATGTAAASLDAAADPQTEFSSASILDGVESADIPICRVNVSELAPKPEWLLPTIMPISRKSYIATQCKPISSIKTGDWIDAPVYAKWGYGDLSVDDTGAVLCGRDGAVMVSAGILLRGSTAGRDKQLRISRKKPDGTTTEIANVVSSIPHIVAPTSLIDVEAGDRIVLSIGIWSESGDSLRDEVFNRMFVSYIC